MNFNVSLEGKTVEFGVIVVLVGSILFIVRVDVPLLVA